MPISAKPAALKVDGLAADLPAEWAANHALFPRGVDMILCAGDQIAALPRTVQIRNAWIAYVAVKGSERAVDAAHAWLATERLPPGAFSGGGQQRVNLARGLIAGHSVPLLDEPTASLDDLNRDVVIGLIREATGCGAAVVGILHDAAVRGAVSHRTLNVHPYRDAA